MKREETIPFSLVCKEKNRIHASTVPAPESQYGSASTVPAEPYWHGLPPFSCQYGSNGIVLSQHPPSARNNSKTLSLNWKRKFGFKGRGAIRRQHTSWRKYAGGSVLAQLCQHTSCSALTPTLKAPPGKTHAPGLCGGMGIVKYHLSLPESAWLGLLLDNSWGAYFHQSLNTTVGQLLLPARGAQVFTKKSSSIIWVYLLMWSASLSTAACILSGSSLQRLPTSWPKQTFGTNSNRKTLISKSRI